MGLIQIDVVRLQPLQGALHGLLHVSPRKARLSRHDLHRKLRRDQDLVATAARLQPLAEHVLRLAALVPRHPGRIGIRGVDEVEPCGNERIQHFEGRPLVRRPAKHVAAQCERRELQARITEESFGSHGIVAVGY